MNFYKTLLIAAITFCGFSMSKADDSVERQIQDADHILSEQIDFVPATTWGTAKRYLAHCSQLDADYTVDVLLPEGYSPSDSKRYPVVYMHDGQNLFDPAISFAGVSWEVDKALSRLSGWDEFLTPIVVGIHNRG